MTLFIHETCRNMGCQMQNPNEPPADITKLGHCPMPSNHKSLVKRYCQKLQKVRLVGMTIPMTGKFAQQHDGLDEKGRTRGLQLL